jgi:hypothetical protein
MGPPIDISAGRKSVSRRQRLGSMMATVEGQRRVAHCECGAQLAGDNDHELFEAVQLHLAHHHPQLLGALEPEVVLQMAENVAGAPPTGTGG